MIAHQNFTDIRDRESGIAALLDMIERRAPILMRTSVGGLSRIVPGCEKRMTEADRSQARNLLAAGKTVKEVREETGWSERTIQKLISHNP